MAKKRRIKPGEKVALEPTSAEREVLRGTIILDEDIESRIRVSVAGRQEIRFTLEELDELAGYVAAEANHAENRRRQRRLDRICEKVESLLGTFEEE